MMAVTRNLLDDEVVIRLPELLTYTVHNSQNSKGQMTGKGMTTLASFRYVSGSNDFIFLMGPSAVHLCADVGTGSKIQ